MKSSFIKYCLFIVLISIYACNGSKKIAATDKKPPVRTNPTTPEKQEKTSEKDSAIVYDPRSIPEKPIKDRPKQEDPVRKLKKETINVVLALPMDGSYEVDRFAEFINGFGLASESLASGKPKIRINVVNVGNLNTEDDIFRKNAFQNVDILIGGYQTSQVKTLAKIAMDRKIPYLSIWNTSEEIINDNPFYVQLKPSLSSYCNAIADFVSTQLRPQLVLIMVESHTSKENTTVESFKRIYDNNGTRYKVIYVNENNIDWKTTVTGMNNVVFNIPNWENRTFVSSILNQINGLKKNKSFIVTGMPQWVDWDQMDFNLYEQLSLHIPLFNYVDMSSMNATFFNENYFNKFNTWPTMESYYGGDILQMVRKIALDLSEEKPFNPNNQISGSYFSNYKITNYKKADLEMKNDEPSYNHNTFITIEKFEGGRFVQIQ